jgi:23S rRNA pseudouridine2605 synthase
MSTPRDPFLLPGDEPPVGEKLQKFLSAAGVASRRHAEVLIKQGRVTVNGAVAQLGMRVVEDDTVRVNGVEVGPQAPRFFLLNKPTGVVTTLDDPQGRRTVAEFVPDDVRVYPVGRLDYDTSGLLLLTNDGELANRLMHPSFGVTKTYRVLVEGGVSEKSVRQLAEGVELEDGITSPAEARVVDAGAKQSVIELTIHEGRNRQVRRMCEAIGHPVIELARTAYGPLTLANLKPGTARPLSDQEIRRLRKAAGLAPPRTSDRVQTRAERRAAEQAAKAAAGEGSEEQVVERDRKADAGAGRNADPGKQAKQSGKRAASGGAGRGSGGSRGRSGGGAGSGSSAGSKGRGRDRRGSSGNGRNGGGSRRGG